MNPIEKARDLYEKFSIYTSTGSEDDDFGEYEKANKYFNKNACLLCVDEIIKANPTETVDGALFTLHPVNGMVKVDNTKYWKQVKEELKKM